MSESLFMGVMLVVGGLCFVFARRVGQFYTEWQESMRPFSLVLPEEWNAVLARASGGAMAAGAITDLLGGSPDVIAKALLGTLGAVFVIYGVLAYREAGKE